MIITSIKRFVLNLYSYFIAKSFDVRSRGFQSLVLFCAWIGAMGFNFLVSLLTTRILGPALFGDLRFIQTVWMLLTLLATFGFLQSGSRVLLLETNPTYAKQVVGVVLVLALIMGILVGLVIALIAHPVDYFFHTHLASIMLSLAPLIIGIPLRDALLLILQSTNQIILLAALEFFPSLFYMVGLYIISKMTVINTVIILAIQQISLLGVVLVIIFVVQPRIGSFRHYLRKILEVNRGFGFPIYTGLIATFATSYLNRLSISLWVNNTAIGFFSLASTIVEPLRLLPNAAAISSFKSFSNQEKISKKAFWFTLTLSFFTLVAAWLFIDPLLSWFYPKGFSSVGPMARILALAALAQGLGDFYNRFLGAHGKGKNLRNVAYIVGIVNLMGIILITPFLGVNGVVITTVLAGLSNITFMFIVYKKYTVELGRSHLPRVS